MIVLEKLMTTPVSRVSSTPVVLPEHISLRAAVPGGATTKPDAAFEVLALGSGVDIRNVAHRQGGNLETVSFDMEPRKMARSLGAPAAHVTIAEKTDLDGSVTGVPQQLYVQMTFAEPDTARAFGTINANVSQSVSGELTMQVIDKHANFTISREAFGLRMDGLPPIKAVIRPVE